MRLRVGHRVFAPPLWAALASAATIAAFVMLASWQVRRGHEKQALVGEFERGTRTVVELHAGEPVEALPRYQHVRVAGRYEPAHQVLLDNMPSKDGRPGYRVLTPFEREGGGRTLLVDRGWVPLGASRETLPPVDVSPQPRVVTGRLDGLPQPGVRVGEAGVAGDEHWPRVLNFPRTRDVEAALGRPVEPRIVLLDAEAADGYERSWRPSLGFGPERHYGYAVQWFALAAVVAVAFVATNLHPANEGDGTT